MEDLKQATFFDRKVLQIVTNVLMQRRVSVISSSDRFFVEKSDVIRELNRLSPNGLSQLLLNVQNYVPLTEALAFLITTAELGRGDEGIEALTVVKEEEKQVSKKMLEEILLLGKDMPFGWAVPLVGENGEDRYQPPPPPKSSLDFERLRNFK